MSVLKWGNLTFELTEGDTAYTVISCEKEAVEAVIPRLLEGLPVRSIYEHAFEGCKRLERVIFPEPTEEDILNDRAFTEIGEYAFCDCISLKEVILPSTVNTIERGAFYCCSSLEKAVFFGAFVGSYAFSGCKKLQIVSPVYHVSEGAFRDCESLQYFPVTDDIEYISEDGFEHCAALTEIVIPRSVKSIHGLAFRGCRGLKKVVFEETAGWRWHCVYTDEWKSLDVSDPEKNAKNLGLVDFDDGVSEFSRE